MSTFYILYDKPLDLFRDDVVVGDEGLIEVANQIAEYTKGDKESYTESIVTEQEALDFLKDYDYDLVPITERDADLFGELLDRNNELNNRLSRELHEEFKERAQDLSLHSN